MNFKKLLLSFAMLTMSLIGFSNIKNQNKVNITNATAEEIIDIDFSNDPINNDSVAQEYYKNISKTSSGKNLIIELYNLIHPKKCTGSYSGIWNYLPYSDADPDNPTSGKIIAFYRGTPSDKGAMNKEHVWPGSRGGESMEGDPHMIRPTLSKDNSSRGNSFYVEGKNSSSMGWDPYADGMTESYRGDAARIIFYSAVQEYNKLSLVDASIADTISRTSGYMGKLSDLLRWNLKYPISKSEKFRNEVLNGENNSAGKSFSLNRNPFIDDRTYACRIWGNTNDETKSICSKALNNEKPTSLTINATSHSLAVNSELKLSVTATPENGSTSVTWSSSNPNVATINNGVVKGISEGQTLITATSTLDKNITATYEIYVKSIQSISISGTLLKATYVEGQTFDPTGLIVTAHYNDGSKAIIDNDSLSWLDANTRKTTLSLNTTSVIAKIGSIEVLYEGIIVEELQGGSFTININSFTSLSNSYAFNNWSSNDITGKAFIYGGTKNRLQFNNSKASYYLFNETPTPGPINKVTVKTNTGVKSWELRTNDESFGEQSGYPTHGTSIGLKDINTNGVSFELSNNSHRYFSLNYVDTGVCYLDEIVIEYGGSDTSDKYLVDLEVKGELIKKEYIVDESFDASGLTINAIYNDGSSIDVTNKVSWSNLTLNSTSVTGNYVEGNITKTITINGLTIKPVTINDLDVSINKNVIDINEVANINVTFTPINTTNKNVTITADKDNIVSINGLNITGLNRGEVTLTITSNDNSNISKQLNIKVYSSSFANEVKAAIKEAKNEFSVIRENVRDLSNINTKITNAKELVSTLYEEEKTLINEDINTITSLENAYNFLNNTWYKDIRDENNTMCDIVTNKELATNLINKYNALDEITKEILSSSYDTTGDDGQTISIGSSIKYISEVLKNNNDNNNPNFNPSIDSNITTKVLVPITIVTVLIIISIIVFLIKRKKAA